MTSIEAAQATSNTIYYTELGMHTVNLQSLKALLSEAGAAMLFDGRAARGSGAVSTDPHDDKRRRRWFLVSIFSCFGDKVLRYIAPT